MINQLNNDVRLNTAIMPNQTSHLYDHSACKMHKTTVYNIGEP